MPKENHTLTSEEETRRFSSARWIWPESHHWDLHNCYALFRKAVDLPARPSQAPLWITADQSYQLYINGRYVGRGPARGFQSHWPYDELDVAAFLREGQNIIAIRAHNPGFGNFQYVTEGYAGLLLAAEWGDTKLVSDATWKCRRQEGVNRNTVPTSLQLFSQEHIDLRREDPDWMTPRYDDSGWTGRVAAAIWNAMPWPRLEKRGIPQLEEAEVEPVQVVGIQEGESSLDDTSPRDVSRLFFAEGLAHEPVSSPAGEILIPASGPGKFRRVLLDFGRTVVGSLGLRITGAGGGEIIDSLHVETIDPETLSPHYQPGTYCKLAFSHRLICRKGENEHVFYHPFGFRYAVLAVRDSSTDLRVCPFVRTTLYPLEIKGAFVSSDPDLSAIWQTCAWTQRVCSLDAFVDTPWREQAQWWGDARVQFWNTNHLSGDTRLFRRGIAQIAGQTTPNGLTYGHAPTIAHVCILPDFSLIWILTLWDYYWQTGSTEPLEDHATTIEGILEYFRTQTDPETGLIRSDPRYWLFLDWTDLLKEGCPSLLSLWLVLALEKLADLYAIRQETSRSAELREWAAHLRTALQKLFGPDGLLADGYDESGKCVRETSIHSQTLALWANLNPSSNPRMMDEVLLPFIRETKVGKARPSAYWITYVFTALQRQGHGQEVVEYIRKHWRPMVAHGTTWENFHPEVGNESFSHAWSAHPLYHFMQVIGGITQSAPAWETIDFEPNFIGDHNETVIPTPRGLIESSWRREESGLRVHLHLPGGTKARVRLPGREPETVVNNNEWFLEKEPPTPSAST